MKASLKAKWVKALRSGDYAQTTSSLRGRNDDSFCCLGVLCEVANVPRTIDGYRFGSVKSATGLRGALAKAVGVEARDELIRMNDEDGYTFAMIAQWIEDNIQAEAQS